MMLDEACELYSADAVRFALADAGDSLEDANFERKRADSAVTMLYVEEIFARAAMRDSAVGRKDQLQLRDGELSYFVDRAFKNELGALIAETLTCYEGMRWRDGIQVFPASFLRRRRVDGVL